MDWRKLVIGNDACGYPSEERELMKSRWLIVLLAIFMVIPTFAQISGIPEDTPALSNIGPLSVKQDCPGMANISFAVTNGTGTFSTTSTKFVDLPAMSVTFTIPGTVASCLKVDLSAVTYALSGELISMRVLLDGTEIRPGRVQWSGNDSGWAAAHAFSFYAFGVSPGVHTVKAQANSYSGSIVWVHWRSLGVQHK
jgi:hypothetical protein